MLQNTQDTRSLGELFGDLTREVGNLVRDEVALAKTEMTEKATKAGKNIAFISVGGMLAFAGLLVVLAAIVLALSNVMPDWAAALLVGAVVLAIAGVLIMKGISAFKNASLAPQQTIQTLKEDAQWAKQQLH
jgi:uncharacterized membrane protein